MPLRSFFDFLCMSCDDLCSLIGEKRLTDASGRIEAPMGEGVLAVARRETTSAVALFLPAALGDGGDQIQTAVLLENADIDVTVVDGDGKPVRGLPVALRLRSDGQVADCERTTTDSLGGATLAHLQSSLEGARISFDGVSVALGILASPPCEQALSIGPLPSQVTLICPPLGILEVQVVDARGELQDGTWWIDVAISPSPERSTFVGSGLVKRQDDIRVQTVARNGSALVSAVGLGLQLEVQVTTRDEGRSQTVLATGPAQAGERVVVRVPM